MELLEYIVRVGLAALGFLLAAIVIAVLIGMAMPEMPVCSSVDRYWTDDGWQTVPIGNDGHGPGIWNCRVVDDA